MNATDLSKLYTIIKAIENKEDDMLNFLYGNGLIDLQTLWKKCAKELYILNVNNYPRKLTELELEIFRHSPAFVETMDGRCYFMGDLVYAPAE